MDGEIPGVGGHAAEPVRQLQVDDDLGMCGMEGGHDPCDMTTAEAERRDDAQMAGDLATPVGEGVLEFLERAEHAQAAIGQQLAFVGQGQHAAGAVDELHAEPLLQRAQPLADRGRGDIELARGRGERARARYGGEEAQIFGGDH